MGSTQRNLTVCLARDLDSNECARRNALSAKLEGMTLRRGQAGNVLEFLEQGTAFLVEFNDDHSGACIWLGILYSQDVQRLSDVSAEAA